MSLAGVAFYSAMLAVLVFAIGRTEERSTRIVLALAVALNLCAVGGMLVAGDSERFFQFESLWAPGDVGYHRD